MKCTEINDLLSLYIDHMLEENQALEVEEHLSSCEACRNEYIAMKEIVDLLGQTEMIPVPDAFQFRLKKALKDEKQSMIESGVIAKPSKKKSQWRMITSIAAVFAVGVISYSLYNDILNIVPDQLNGGAQTEIALSEEEYAVSDDKSGAMEEAGDSGISSDGSVMMKEGATDLQPMQIAEAPASNAALSDGYNSKTNSTDQSASGAEEVYGATADTEPDGGAGSVVPEGTDGLADADRAAGLENNSVKLKTMSPADCSRSLTSSGVERNAAAVQFYDNLIEERLKGFDYQILESAYTKDGVWHFRIFIFRGKDGNTYNEEIMICGKEGEITVLSSNEFMGL